MKPKTSEHSSNKLSHIFRVLLVAFGSFLAAFSIEVFLIPNDVIDGGIVGLSMIFSQLFGHETLPYFLITLNIPFVIMGYKSIGRSFVIHMIIAVVFFAFFLTMLSGSEIFEVTEMLEVVVIGGMVLGAGIGLIIRAGGCLDGTEILGIILSQKQGFSVGQIVLACNIIIFAIAGIVFNDWHTPLQSLMTYIVVIKIMDTVIVGLEETKSVTVISSKSKAISEAVIHELGLGLTIVYGRGGFSGEDLDILYVITERLQLAELKEIVYREDPLAFLAVENLHEVVNGRRHSPTAIPSMSEA